MRTVLLFFAVLWTSHTTFAQENWGKIIFANRNIPTLSGTGGGNGNGTYNVPIWQYPGPGDGAGDLPGGVTVGLFLNYSSVPLATTVLRTDANSQFFATSATPVSVPGVPPGASATLTVRAWQGSRSFQDARLNGSQFYEETMITRPLGGVPPNGGPEIPTPIMTGWAYEDGRGVILRTLGPEVPRTEIGTPWDDPIVAAPDEIQITGSAVGYSTSQSTYVITNFVIYANSTIISTQIPTSTFFTVHSPPLAPGTYTLTSVMRGHWIDSANRTWPADEKRSRPVTITVVDPVNITLTQPTVSDGQLTFRFTANPGLRYHISTSTDLRTWRPVATNTPASSPAIYSQAVSGSSSAFYRVTRATNR